MLAETSAIDGAEWFDRSEHWLDSASSSSRNLRTRRTEPLTLCGHGISLKVDGGALLIRDGRTHHPQSPALHRFFKGDPATPQRIILLDGSGSVSFDVLDWMGEQGVALVRLGWRGDVLSAVGGSGYAADPAKVRWQMETRADPTRRLAFACGIIGRKIEASIHALSALPSCAKAERAVEKLRGKHSELSASPPSDIATLRGLEGGVSANYFSAWQGTVLKWTGTGKRPIPDAWRTIGARSAVRVGKIPKNERATHPLNAMLNYAYAALQSELRIKAISDGYDPTLGIMHHSYQGSPAYTFDLMEPERPVVDSAILRFIQSEVFTPADFSVRSDGACRLSPQLARRVVEVSACLLSRRPD